MQSPKIVLQEVLHGLKSQSRERERTIKYLVFLKEATYGIDIVNNKQTNNNNGGRKNAGPKRQYINFFFLNWNIRKPRSSKREKEV